MYLLECKTDWNGARIPLGKKVKLWSLTDSLLQYCLMALLSEEESAMDACPLTRCG